MPRLVTSAEVEAYAGLVEPLARRISGYGDSEYDDLVQEGNIAVFIALGRSRYPSKIVVRGAMLNWVRYLRRLVHGDEQAYEQYLAFDYDQLQ